MELMDLGLTELDPELGTAQPLLVFSLKECNATFLCLILPWTDPNRNI